MNLDSLRVTHIMSSPVETLSASQSLPLAQQLMKQRRIRHLPVVDEEQRMVGLVSHRDILRAQHSSQSRMSESIRSELENAIPVSQLMTTEIWTTRPETSALAAARELLSHGFSCLPVVDADQRLVGIVTEADFVQLVVRALRQFASVEVGTLMTRNVVTLREDEDLWLAEGLMGLKKIRHLPVVDDRGHLVGLVTHRDLLAAQHSVFSGRTHFPPRARVADIMHREVWTISPTASALDAARTLSDHTYGCLPVVERGKLVGIVTEADFMRLLLERAAPAAVEPLSRQAPVSYFMSAPVRTIVGDASVAEADGMMTRYGMSSLAVVVDDALVGVISRSDLLRLARPSPARLRGLLRLDLPDQPVASIMTPRPCTVSANDAIAVAAAQLVERRISQVIVVDGSRPVGVLSASDFPAIVRALRITRPAHELMSGVALAADSAETIASAARFLGQARVHALLVESGGWVVGLFGQAEVLASRDLDPATPVERVMSHRVFSIPLELPLHIAAGQAAELGARMIAVVANDQVFGVLTPTDFARACLLPE